MYWSPNFWWPIGIQIDEKCIEFSINFQNVVCDLPLRTQTIIDATAMGSRVLVPNKHLQSSM